MLVGLDELFNKFLLCVCAQEFRFVLGGVHQNGTQQTALHVVSILPLNLFLTFTRMVLHRALPVELKDTGGRIWKPSKRKGRAQTEPTPSVPTKHFLTGVPETVFKADFKPIWDTRRSYLPMKRSRVNRSNPVTGQTTLQQAAVKPVTRQKYLKHWEEFCLWSSLNRWKISTSEEVDLALTMFLEEAYLDGGDLSLGRYIVAAVTFVRPELKTLQCRSCHGQNKVFRGGET